MEDPKRAMSIYAQTTQEDPASAARLLATSRQMTEPLPGEPLRQLLPVKMGAEARVLARYRASRPMRWWWVGLPAAAAVAVGLLWWTQQDEEIPDSPPQMTEVSPEKRPLPEKSAPRSAVPRPKEVVKAPLEENPGPVVPESVQAPLPIPQEVFEEIPLEEDPPEPPVIAELPRDNGSDLRIAEVKPPSARALAARLSSTDFQGLHATEDVDLRYKGVGVLSGDSAAPRIAWESGTLHVDVTPKKGIDLQVRTADAEVHVVGTTFEVERSPLGTYVTVEHGRVWVACAAGQRMLLSIGEEGWCLPAEASGLLARALTLRERGESAGVVLDSLEMALTKAKPGSVLASEIAFQRLWTLSSLRDPRLEAELGAFLASNPKQRGDDARRLHVRWLVENRQCETAARVVEQMSARDLRAAAAKDLESCR